MYAGGLLEKETQLIIPITDPSVSLVSQIAERTIKSQSAGRGAYIIPFKDPC